MTAEEDARVVERLSLLTPKERECLHLVLQNWSSKEIARQLGVSHTSVDTYVRRARAKLGLRDRYAAARLLEQCERQEGFTRQPAPAAADRPAGAPRPAYLLPPLEDLGMAARLGLVLAGAVVILLIFGVVLTAMQAL